MSVAGKTALVTGGSRGIGRACVRALAAGGAKVAFVYHGNREAADAVAAELAAAGHDVHPIQADVTDFDRAETLVEELIQDWGRLDILVNSAGIVRDGLFATMGPEAWREVLETNLTGTYNYCHAATRPMMSQ